ncbi:MAG TPA: hypothetical protein VFK89_02180, partial [Actinomycetota bacterium]|nr:hypothetical protein [Actinomycetota bacterium]
GITDGRPGTLVNCSMLTDGRAPDRVGTQWECRLRLDELPFLSRLYQVYCEVHGHGGRSKLMKWSQVTAFRMLPKPVEGPVSLVQPGKSGAIELPYEWNVIDEGSPESSTGRSLP